jgi:hypothetical protein
MAEAAAVADGESLDMSAGAAAHDPATAFAEQSHLTYVVPSATGLELEDLFEDAEQGQSIIDSIQRRESLFFGMWSHQLTAHIHPERPTS